MIKPDIISVDHICANCKFMTPPTLCIHPNNIKRKDNVFGGNVYNMTSIYAVREDSCKGDWWELHPDTKSRLNRSGYNEDGTKIIKPKSKFRTKIEYWMEVIANALAWHTW